MQVLLEAQNGKKPRRPAGPAITDTIWSRINECWVDEPEQRPSMEQLCSNLRRMFHNASSWQALTQRRSDAGSSESDGQGGLQGEIPLPNDGVDIEAVVIRE